MTGETITIVKKNIGYWQNRSKPRSKASISFFKDEMKKRDDYMKNLTATSWKHNLTGLYFNNHAVVYQTYRGEQPLLHDAPRLTDRAEQIRESVDPTEKNNLLGAYFTLAFNPCGAYETIYHLLEKDMDKVKNELQFDKATAQL